VSPPRRPGAFAFALRLALREWRSGEMRLLAAALAVAVAGLTSVGFFTDRVERAMSLRAAELLAADLALEARSPIGEALAARARTLGLATARTASFSSVVMIAGQFQLVEVKAVSEGYPLRGRLRVAPEPYAPDRPVTTVPEPGTVWLDPRLMSLTGLATGERIELGAASFTVAAALSYEPDRGGELFTLAPRVLMHEADLPATGLVQPGSRVEYRLLLAGEPATLARFRDTAEPELGAGAHFHGVEDARPELRIALERAKQFLGLAALVGVLLAGAAIALACRRHAARQLDGTAVLRCFGASQGFIARVHALEIGLIGLAASLLGCGLGFAAQAGLASLLGPLLLGELPAPSWAPLAQGLATGLVTVAGFALPPLMRLKDVPPARVLRRDLGSLPARVPVVYASALAAFSLLVVWQARDAWLAGYVLAGGALALAALALGGAALVRALAPLRSRVGVSLRFGLASIARRAGASVVQLVAFGLGATVLLLLGVVRGDLLAEWQRSLPADTPNFFLVNIQPDETGALEAFLASRGLDTAELYPMVRARLRAIGERAVRGEDYADPRARRLATREFNLSWSGRLAPDNRVVAGRWWGDGTQSSPPPGSAGVEFSVEEGLAGTLGIALGDRLAFEVAGERLAGPVTSLRSVEWDSFRVNFFVITPPGALDGYPATYVTSFYLPEARHGLLVELVQRFPSVTVLDVGALLDKVREIMDQAVVGVQYVFLFTLLAGLLVLFAAVQATVDERRFEAAVVRAFGGSHAALTRALAAEFVTIGLLAGLLAAAAASAIGAVLASRVFQLAYHGDPWLWVLGVTGGGLGVGVAGLLATRPALAHPPLLVMRDS